MKSMRGLKAMVMISLLLIFASCNREATPNSEVKLIDTLEKDNVEVENKRSTVYGCPVHANVISEKPGVCPLCNRTLVQRTD